LLTYEKNGGTKMDIKGITKALMTYFEANTMGSGAKMREVFHDVAHIYGHNPDGTLGDMDMTAFVKLVDSSVDPSKPQPPPMDEIVSVAFTGENTAVVCVKVRFMDVLYTDILSLIRIGGKWFIISKLYSGEPIV